MEADTSNQSRDLHTIPQDGFMADNRIIRNDIVAVGLLGLIVFLVAAVATYDPADRAQEVPQLLIKIYQPDQLIYPTNETFHNACGRLGAWTADMLVHVLGVGVYFLIAGLIAMEIAVFRREPTETPWLKSVGWAVALLGITTLGSMLLPDWTVAPLIGAGGYLGALSSGLLSSNVGAMGCLVAGVAMTVVGMMMWTEYLIFSAGRVAFSPAIVAASAILPFGLVHGFVQWFNGQSEQEYEDEEDEDREVEYVEDDPHDEEISEEERRIIRFRRRERDAEVFDEVEIGAGGRSADAVSTLDAANADDQQWEEELETVVAAVAAQPGTQLSQEIGDDEDEYEDEYEGQDGDEDEARDEVDAARASLNIQDNTSKTPIPAIEPASNEDVEGEVLRIDQPEAKKSKPHFKVPAKKESPSERDVMISQLDAAALVDNAADYELPPIAMLEAGDTLPFEQQKREALIKAEILEKTCKQFGFIVKVVEIETGPVISQYEIDLEPGLRLQKIVALADDLAIAMRVPSVRIVAPIPGKNSVGVEVPNETRQMVRLRGVMEQCEAQIKKMKIPLFLGSDAVGAPMVADLASLPHLLIAGRTGTGKSVCLNAIISSILMTRRPDEVRMLMIDPKMVELSGYGRLPHLMHPVVTDMRKAEAILAWAVDKMEERYQLLAKAGVRHVTTFNQLGHEEIIERLAPETDEERDAIPTNLPFIVIVADEMADLMMTAGKDVETHIIRLAQKSRAVGIHLILATQKPTVDVITGLIKSNLPARIAFQVASKTDSRVVLDAQGADKLLGCGDMLFLWPGTSTLLRGQGTYLSDNEIDNITDAVSTGEQNFVHELVNIKVKAADDQSDSDDGVGAAERKKDKLYEEAIDIVVREQRGSLSYLQRALGIGYGRAARLIDYMEEDGYVGAYNGSKSREVLLTQAVWDNIKNGDPNPVNDEDWPEEKTADAKTQPAEEPSDSPVPQPKIRTKPTTRQRKPLTNLADANRVTNLAANQSDAVADPEVEEEQQWVDQDEYEEEFEDDDVVSMNQDDSQDEGEEEFEDEDGDFDEGDYEEADEEADEELKDEDYDPEQYEDVD